MSELTLLIVRSVRCFWCGNLIAPSDTKEIEVHDDEESELPTGTALVCCDCLKAFAEA